MTKIWRKKLDISALLDIPEDQRNRLDRRIIAYAEGGSRQDRSEGRDNYLDRYEIGDYVQTHFILPAEHQSDEWVNQLYCVYGGVESYVLFRSLSVKQVLTTEDVGQFRGVDLGGVECFKKYLRSEEGESLGAIETVHADIERRITGMVVGNDLAVVTEYYDNGRPKTLVLQRDCTADELFGQIKEMSWFRLESWCSDKVDYRGVSLKAGSRVFLTEEEGQILAADIEAQVIDVRGDRFPAAECLAGFHKNGTLAESVLYKEHDFFDGDLVLSAGTVVGFTDASDKENRFNYAILSEARTFQKIRFPAGAKIFFYRHEGELVVYKATLPERMKVGKRYYPLGTTLHFFLGGKTANVARAEYPEPVKISEFPDRLITMAYFRSDETFSGAEFPKPVEIQGLKVSAAFFYSDNSLRGAVIEQDYEWKGNHFYPGDLIYFKEGGLDIERFEYNEARYEEDHGERVIGKVKYLVSPYSGTPVYFYENGKVRSGTLAVEGNFQIATYDRSRSDETGGEEDIIVTTSSISLPGYSKVHLSEDGYLRGVTLSVFEYDNWSWKGIRYFEDEEISFWGNGSYSVYIKKPRTFGDVTFPAGSRIDIKNDGKISGFTLSERLDSPFVYDGREYYGGMRVWLEGDGWPAEVYIDQQFQIGEDIFPAGVRKDVEYSRNAVRSVTFEKAVTFNDVELPAESRVTLVDYPKEERGLAVDVWDFVGRVFYGLSFSVLTMSDDEKPDNEKRWTWAIDFLNRFIKESFPTPWSVDLNADGGMVGGVRFPGGAANIRFHPNGRVAQAFSWKPIRIGGRSFPAETTLFFDERGRLRPYIEHSGVRLPTSTRLEVVEEDGRYYLKKATLGEPWTLEGYNFPSSTVLEFCGESDRRSILSALVTNRKKLFIDGDVEVHGGNKIYFGWSSAGSRRPWKMKLSGPWKYCGVNWAKGTQMSFYDMVTYPLREVFTYRDHRVAGQTFHRHTEFHYPEGGYLYRQKVLPDYAVITKEHEIRHQGQVLRCHPYSVVAFHNNGGLKYVTLNHEEEIQGHIFPEGTVVGFDDEGYLSFVILAELCEVGGKWFDAEHVLRFDEAGAVVENEEIIRFTSSCPDDPSCSETYFHYYDDKGNPTSFMLYPKYID